MHQHWDTMTDQGHLTERQIAGFLDVDLPFTERRLVEAHLDACDECRAEMVEIARMILTAPPAEPTVQQGSSTGTVGTWRGWRLPVGLGGLAAAALASVFLWTGPTSQEPAPQERFGQEGVPTLETHAPQAGAVVRREELRFTWTDRGVDAYRLTLTAQDGGLLWTHTTADTLVVPPQELDVPRGETLYWFVDGLEAGVVARSGAHSFMVAP